MNMNINYRPETEAEAKAIFEEKYSRMSDEEAEKILNKKLTYKSLLYYRDMAYGGYIAQWKGNEYSVRNRGTDDHPDYSMFNSIEFGNAYASYKNAGHTKGISKMISDAQHQVRSNVYTARSNFKMCLKEIRDKVRNLKPGEKLTTDEQMFFENYGNMSDKEITEEFIRINFEIIVPLIKKIWGWERYSAYAVGSPKEKLQAYKAKMTLIKKNK